MPIASLFKAWSICQAQATSWVFCFLVGASALANATYIGNAVSMANDLFPPPEAAANVLDHAREFVELVRREAPAAYESLLREPIYVNLLHQADTFNHGKLFVYAEYLVFREEFRRRFPDASQPACINAFSRLLLKNDISMTNLIDALEGESTEQILLLHHSD